MAELIEDPGFSKTLEAALLQDLQDALPQATNSRIQLAQYSEARLVAGLEGSTSYGWFLIKLLWVEKSKRKQGLARALLTQACAEAAQRGCHSAWQDTSNPEARMFYEHQGFTCFGALHNKGGQQPAGHSRWFLQRAIDLRGSAPDLTDNKGGLI